VAGERKRGRGSRGRRAVAEDDQQSLHPTVPASVAHSGEVDEFDAAIVQGAGGSPPEEPPPTRSADGDVEGEGDGRGLAERVERAVTPARRQRPPGNRVINFLRASWAELQRVQWPDREQVGQATAVVLGFVVIAGLYLGLADWVAQKVVNAIL
jgi:preprotein translocase SecE subunit